MSPQVVVSICDGVHGRPATGVPVRIEYASAAGAERLVGATDGNGRWAPRLDELVASSRCQVAVDSASYYATMGIHSPVADLVVAVVPHRDVDVTRVSLVIAPCAYTVYLSV